MSTTTKRIFRKSVFIHDNVPVAGQIGQFLHFARRPANGQLLHSVRGAQSKMDDAGHLGAEAVDGIHFSDDRLSLDRGDEAGADAELVALAAAQGDFQVMLVGEVILVHEYRPTARLAKDQIELAMVAEVSRDDAAAVAVTVGAGQEADVEEIAAAVRTADIEESSLSLISAQIMAFGDDVPRIFHPELAQRLVELSRLFDGRASIIGL